MARPKDAVISEQEQRYLNWNLQAMQTRFAGDPIEGKKLHLIKRYAERPDDFRLKLEEHYPVLYEGLKYLSSGKTLAKNLNGQTPYKAVQELAIFCTQVFAFQHTVTAEDLLTKIFDPFPPIRKVSGLWGRYTGMYRCFYLEPSTDTEEICGAFFYLREFDSFHQCYMVIGIREDWLFDKVETLVQGLKDNMNPLVIQQKLIQSVSQCNQEARNKGAQVYYYEGTIDDRTIPDHHLIHLRRHDSNHTLSIFLRSWRKSQKNLYSGGIGTAIRCRTEEILTYPMIFTRSEELLSFSRDTHFLLSHLKKATLESRIKVTKDMDELLDQGMRSR